MPISRLFEISKKVILDIQNNKFEWRSTPHCLSADSDTSLMSFVQPKIDVLCDVYGHSWHST